MTAPAPSSSAAPWVIAGAVAFLGVVVGVVGLATGAFLYLRSAPPPVASPAPDGATPDGATPGDPGAAPVASTAARAGYLTGTIRDEQGRPIGVAGAVFKIGVHGVSEESGEKVDYSPAVGPDGAYEAKLVDGIYHPIRAVVEVTWNGSSYRFDLDPVQEDTADRDSKDGIVQDFVWRLTGPHHRSRQNPDPRSPASWYGASVRLSPCGGYRNDLRQPITPPAAGTRYSFTLEPVGKRIDGADARTLTFERTLEGRALDNLHDIPLAVYTLTGVELSLDGERHPLVFEVADGTFQLAPRIEFPMDALVHGVYTPIHAYDRQR